MPPNCQVLRIQLQFGIEELHDVVEFCTGLEKEVLEVFRRSILGCSEPGLQAHEAVASDLTAMATFHEITQLKTGVALEVATSRPEQEHRCTRVAFCLHPWSRLGGCMYDS